MPINCSSVRTSGIAIHQLLLFLQIMASSKANVIVFGATGFTGKYIVRECAKKNNFSWSVAGRNEAKLRELLEHVSLDVGLYLVWLLFRRIILILWLTIFCHFFAGTDVTQKEIIIADCSQPESLTRMADRGKVVINCTGPYRFYGESVVKACIDCGTHYVDVTGEPEVISHKYRWNGIFDHFRFSWIVSIVVVHGKNAIDVPWFGETKWKLRR